jgi:hypothetical protein
MFSTLIVDPKMDVVHSCLLTNGMCVKDLKLIKYHIKKAYEQNNNELNFKTIFMDF